MLRRVLRPRHRFRQVQRWLAAPRRRLEIPAPIRPPSCLRQWPLLSGPTLQERHRAARDALHRRARQAQVAPPRVWLVRKRLALSSYRLDTDKVSLPGKLLGKGRCLGNAMSLREIAAPIEEHRQTSAVASESQPVLP